jgi:hypothetical protein
MSKTEQKNAEKTPREVPDLTRFKNSNNTDNLLTHKSTTEQNGAKKRRKNAENFVCELCDFKCFKHSDWTRHIATRKHLAEQIGAKNAEKRRKNAAAQQTGKNNREHEICQNGVGNLHTCIFCDKTYKHKRNLTRHQCSEKNKNTDKPEISTELVLQILKDNNNFKELLIDQNKTIIELANNTQIVNTNNKTNNNNNNNVNNNNNNNNKTFNLQLFLNETCKDAMNLSDFVNSIKQQFSDLEYIENYGFVNGISKIFIKNLNSLKQELRPIHCTDEKRKIIYVKDNNIWEKEDDNHTSVRKAIKTVAKGAFMLMREFKKEFTDWDRHDSRNNTRYHNLMLEVLGGSGKEDADNESKIIINISKEIKIKK